MSRKLWRQVIRRNAQTLARLDCKSRLTYPLLLAILIAAVVHARAYSGALIDDAFITFRHSSNLIHGHGLSYNWHERVEGTSSFLFALLMAVPIALGADPYRVAGLLGCVAFAACSLAAYLGVRACVRDDSGRALALGAAALVAASSPLAFHSQTGLETVLFASLVGLAFASRLAAAASPRPSPAWASIFGVASLVRPEGFVLFSWCFALACLGRGRAPGALASAKLELKRFAFVFVPLVLFRRVYFGAWLPNSVLAKGGHLGWLLHGPSRAALERVIHGPSASLIGGFVREHATASALTLGTLLLTRTRQAGIAAVGLALLCAASALWSDGDWMPYERLLTPALAPLAVAASLGLRGLFFHREQRSGLGHLPSYAFSGVALAMMMMAARTPLDVRSVRWVDLPRLREMGQRLTRVSNGDDLVATEIAGILPYYWGVPTLDMLGLCDKQIASRGAPQPRGAGRRDLAYVVARRPTFYAFNVAREAAEFYVQPAFVPHQQEYALLRFPYHYLEPLQDLPITVLVRKDRKDLTGLTRAVGGQLVDAAAELKRLGYLN